jgi:hypothetical protein
MLSVLLVDTAVPHFVVSPLCDLFYLSREVFLEWTDMQFLNGPMLLLLLLLLLGYVSSSRATGREERLALKTIESMYSTLHKYEVR